LDRSHIRELIEERALSHDSMDATSVRDIREEMERAEARRLQPHFISSFFLEAFRLLGGTVRESEPKRYEIKHVPAGVGNRDRLIGRGDPMLPRYERITFEKDLITVQGKPLGEFVCLGHPLLDATIDLILERYRELLKRGALLIAPDETRLESVRALCYLEQSIQDARTDRSGNRRVVSRRMQFVEIDEHGGAHNAGYAPYLDYRPATDEERELLRPMLQSGDRTQLPNPGANIEASPTSSGHPERSEGSTRSDFFLSAWLSTNLERRATAYAASSLVPEHLVLGLDAA
jgi:hypothetical protein